MNECCAECRFWGGSYLKDLVRTAASEDIVEYYRGEPDVVAAKYCRRRSPRPRRKPTIVFIWPPTLPSDWCGEFEPMQVRVQFP